MSFKEADLETRVENLLKIATVYEIDAKNYQIKVKSGELISGWIPHLAQIGHNFRAWSPVRKGAQVLVACPSGDFSQAIVVQTLYSDNQLPPSTDIDTDIIEFNDGTVIKKNKTELGIETPCKVKLVAPNTQVDTNLTVNGDFKASGGEFTHNGKNVGNDHKHDGITAGKSTTKEPI